MPGISTSRTVGLKMMLLMFGTCLYALSRNIKACRDTQCQSQFPCQEEGAGTCATLAVLGELDVEKQEPTTNDTRSQAQQYGHKHFYGKILIVERNELRRSYQYQAHNHLTFQVGIGKDYFSAIIAITNPARTIRKTERE